MIDPTFWWMREQARRRYNSAESDFHRFQQAVERLENTPRKLDLRNAYASLSFAAHDVLRAAREMELYGLSPSPQIVQAAREYLSPAAEAERRKKFRK